MDYAKPIYARKDINAAGAILVGCNCPFNNDHALSIINNWRSSHAFPLNAFYVTMRQRARKIDNGALTAQRLKRLPSIAAKLKRFPEMKLSQMQDLGGCRAVVSNSAQVVKLVTAYNAARAKNPNARHEFLHLKNYIQDPKADGYRSVHLIYRYRSRALKHQTYNGLKIEIQIRTKLQHAWATAVEVISTFTGEALKSNIGDEGWKRFFKLMSSHIAFREGSPLVPDTPKDRRVLIDELRQLAAQLHVKNILAGWGTGINTSVELQQKHPKSRFHTYLMILDSKEKHVRVWAYEPTELQKAQQAYLEAEKDNAEKPWIQSVLVSVDSIVALKRAYPNFYLDSAAFAQALDEAIGEGRIEK